ncbi:SDR family NAD(P)-dependent oxidoreductase [Curtobacterium sp. MCBD17_013]|uniref:SDR family NAD(P)-dependent oxidoreductase n=1 Tax=Curtobacterium sp. MCBD17_013 TaxID=2175668 RepID=UPI000DA833FB|nr:SDR family oxidoreductase [Curtobacterium sp. MCBD17_013]PZF63305.1 SDR family NAD(P)-dependent oxidoreductase [Curtobacterium sp. MCBD17_013]
MTRHVLVTGAASGIGLAVATRFATDGALVTMVDLRAEPLDAASASVASVAALGREAVVTITADLREPDAPAAVVDRAWDRAVVDVLVNAAGVYPATPFLQLDAATWDAVQAVNVRAPILATVALARRAETAGTRPCVVNISSGSALRARPGAAPYSTSKAALEMVTRASALELGAAGIRVNAVAPGFVDVDSDVNRVTDEYAAAVSANPLGRRGRPTDIANAVVWLADDTAAEWVTGSILRVDGGSSTGAHALPLSWDPVDARADTDDQPIREETSA